MAHHCASPASCGTTPTRAQLHAAIEIALAGYTNQKGNVSAGSLQIDTAGIFVKEGTAFRRVSFTEVLFAESRDNYVLLMLGSGETAFIRSTLAEFLKRAPKFLQIHRRYAVATVKVSQILVDEVQLGSHALPLSRSYRAALLQALDIR